jgi:hypothetical protein
LASRMTDVLASDAARLTSWTVPGRLHQCSRALCAGSGSQCGVATSPAVHGRFLLHNAERTLQAGVRSRMEHPQIGQVFMLQRSNDMDRYLSAHPDSRFFPPKAPWGQRVGSKLGIPYRGLTTFFMGNATRQAEAILQRPGKITKAVTRAIDAALTPSQPHKYRIRQSLRWGVRRVARPVATTLGLIPGVEALVWDVPRAIGSAAHGKWREAVMTLSIAALDFSPAVVAFLTGIATFGTSVVPVVAAGIAIGWLTEWRYFHPYIREHYSERDERVMQRMLEALTDETFLRRRAHIPANQWERAFPDQARYALAIARLGDKNNVAGAIKQNKLKATHAQLVPQFPQRQQEYEDQRARANSLLAATHGTMPSRWHPIQRRRFNDAYGAMRDAYESIQQFKRINSMHRLLFNAYATRNAMHQEFLRNEAIRRSPRTANTADSQRNRR